MLRAVPRTRESAPGGIVHGLPESMDSLRERTILNQRGQLVVRLLPRWTVPKPLSHGSSGAPVLGDSSEDRMPRSAVVSSRSVCAPHRPQKSTRDGDAARDKSRIDPFMLPAIGVYRYWCFGRASAAILTIR